MSAPAGTIEAQRSHPSTLARVTATRRVLVATSAARALLWAAACAAGVALAARALAVTGAVDTTDVVAPLAVAATFVAVLALLLARGGVRASVESTALWIEARRPELHYALVTLVEASSPALERRVRDVRWEGEVRHAAWRALWPPSLALALLVLAASLVPAATDAARAARGMRGEARTGGAASRADRLSSLDVRVTPPAYSGLPAQSLDDPSAVAALEGSTVVVRGEGDASGLSARVGAAGMETAGDDVRVRGERGAWTASITMPTRPSVLRLADGARQRLLVLEPRADSLPAVSLTQPARDTVLRSPAGVLALAADATDDLGLASAAFEYIVSSGEGESFTFRSGRVGAVSAGGARRQPLRARLVLDSLALKAGDIVHLRAVARDRNPAADHGTGASETRTLRIARAGEYDSLAVEGAPPPDADKSVISQRMLLILTEALVKRRPRITRATLVAESRRIGADQARLRRQVSDIIFSRISGDAEGEHAHFAGDGHGHEENTSTKALTPDELLAAASRATGTGQPTILDAGNESPVVNVNKPLLEAYNHMWDAGRALEVGEPAQAIPPMRRALAAIQRARSAERIYLRGRPPAVVVDVEKARLQGKDTAGVIAPRAPRTPLDPAAARRAARLARAMALASTNAGAAVDSLSLLRVELLGDDATVAAALGQAIDALRAGRDPAAAVARARAALAGERTTSDALGRWSGW